MTELCSFFSSSSRSISFLFFFFILVFDDCGDDGVSGARFFVFGGFEDPKGGCIYIFFLYLIFYLYSLVWVAVMFKMAVVIREIKNT